MSPWPPLSPCFLHPSPLMPPVLPPAPALPSLEEGAPCWNAWGDGLGAKLPPGLTVKDDQVTGVTSPTTCSASDNESCEETSLATSGSEHDLHADTKFEIGSACSTPLAGDCVASGPHAPPGLEGCLCPMFQNCSSNNMLQMCGHCKALLNSYKEAQSLHDKTSAISKAAVPSENEPVRALRLECLL